MRGGTGGGLHSPPQAVSSLQHFPRSYRLPLRFALGRRSHGRDSMSSPSFSEQGEGAGLYRSCSARAKPRLGHPGRNAPHYRMRCLSPQAKARRRRKRGKSSYLVNINALDDIAVRAAGWLSENNSTRGILPKPPPLCTWGWNFFFTIDFGNTKASFLFCCALVGWYQSLCASACAWGWAGSGAMRANNGRSGRLLARPLWLGSDQAEREEN